MRALNRIPSLDLSIRRRCFSRDAASFRPSSLVDAIITSPPYMRQLDYGRDNRVRLWFLGVEDPDRLDDRISPNEAQFLELMRKCLTTWRKILRPGGHCVLVVGDAVSNTYHDSLADLLAKVAVFEVGGYRISGTYNDNIPAARRVRRSCRGSLSENILIMTTTP